MTIFFFNQKWISIIWQFSFELKIDDFPTIYYAQQDQLKKDICDTLFITVLHPLFQSASIGVDIFYCKCRCFKLGTHQSFSVISQLRLHNVQRLDNDDMILWRVDNGYNGHSMIDSIIVHNSYCQWSHKLHKYTISMVKSMFHKLSGNHWNGTLGKLIKMGKIGR